jgi:DNA ligase-1
MIISYPKLFARSNTGSIIIWWIEQEDNKFRVCHGQQEGKIVVDEFTVCQGKNLGKKNETSDIEQCKKEILAKYKDQESTGYFKNVKDIDQQQYFSPMLAKKYEDRKDEIDWSKGNYISPKMDGMRAIITKNGAYSRNGKLFYSFPHILRELKPLFNLYPDLIFDGEIYCDKLNNDFNKIISLAKKSKPTSEDLIESEKYLQYWIFDCPSIKGNFHSRYSYLVKQILCDHGYLNNKWIKICKHTLIKTPEEIEINLHKYIEQGFEGLMVNTYDGKYEQKRSKNLLKYKLFKDTEAEIVDIIEGIGNRSGMFGYAKLKLDNGVTFDANARGNEEFYKEILKNKNKYIGCKATVRYQGLTPDENKPRFPVIVDFNRFD